ncbi:MAG: hypothetical protein QNJ45_00715 [Ardenticatenaceae bacterium]|nr:hypothetical protein [Ardenticatenaceae bacterium]
MEKLISLGLLLVLILAACAPPPPTEIAQEEQPTASSAEETATPVPSPTHTMTPEPSATPLPTQTPSPEPTATDTPTPTPVFTIPRFSLPDTLTIYGEGAAVSRETYQFTDPGAALFHDGQFHMFHNAFTGWPANVDIIYSVSDDGLNWSKVQDEPILTSSDVPFAGVAALAASVIVLEDGTWALYFYTWDENTWPKSTGAIGMATAENPQGPWTVIDDPLLQPGSAEDWDGVGVRTPSVIQTDDGYAMYYAGYSSDEAAIGLATSSDGLSWRKFDDPETTASPFANSDPVFTASGEEIWDRQNAFQPHVQQSSEGLVMLYGSATNVSKVPVNNRHGLAFSSDGVNWIRSDTPVFNARDVRTGGQNIWFAELVYANEIYFLYVELGRGNNTEIYAATFSEPLLTEE